MSDILRNKIRKIVLVGPSGSGKSTLARTLETKLDISATHMDIFITLPHGQKVKAKNSKYGKIKCKKLYQKNPGY